MGLGFLYMNHQWKRKLSLDSASVTTPSMTFLASSSCITLLDFDDPRLFQYSGLCFDGWRSWRKENLGSTALKLMPVVEIVSFSCINAIPNGDKYFSCCSSILTCQFWKHSATFLFFSLAMIFVKSRTARSLPLRSNGLTCTSTSRASIPEVNGALNTLQDTFFELYSIFHSLLFAIHWLHTPDGNTNLLYNFTILSALNCSGFLTICNAVAALSVFLSSSSICA